MSKSSNSGRRGSSEYYDLGFETDDDVDSRYVLQPRHKGDDDVDVLPEYKRRRFENVDAEVPPALPSPTPSSDSERTISDDGGSVVREVFQCCICRKEFGSRQAVRGHMRVHALRKHQELDKKQPVNWASIGKRGRKGSKAVIARFAPKDEVGNSVANVVAEPVLPIVQPIAVARTNLSGSQGSSSVVIAPKDEVDNSMAIVVAEPVLPIAQPIAVARTNLFGGQGSSSAQPISNESNESPNQVVAHQQAAAAPYAAAKHHSPPQPAAAPPQLLLLPRAAQGDQASGPPYRCKVEGCNMMYDTHQGLGGHAAGHANRVKQEAAALAVNGGNTDAKPEHKHPCKVCHREFLRGVALGGHMRKHYAGKLIIQKQKQQQQQHGITLSLSLAPPTAEVAPPALAPATVAAALPPVEPKTEAAEHGAEPAPTPALIAFTRTVRIFGHDYPVPQDGYYAEEGAKPSGKQ
ncbi:hypothetical protein ABZP36_014988 [Zizania latifolia]